MTFNVERKVLAAGIMILLLMAGIGVDSYFSISHLITNTRRAADSLSVRRKAQGMLLTMLNLETGTRGYVITGDDRYLKPYQSAIDGLGQQMTELSQATGDAPKQRQQFKELATLVADELAIEKRHIDLRRMQSFEAAAGEFKAGSGRREMDQIRALVADIVADQDELMSRQNQQGARQARRAIWIICVGGVSGFLFVAASCVVVHRDLERRRKADEEIAALNKALVHHNEQLESINNEMEAFSYSVSHDLRAPLRSLDGFSQALLEDCGDTISSEGQDYLRRIRGASQRMGLLIDDLLNLSRLTRVEMKRETVDLSKMARDTAEELRAANAERAVDIVIADGLTVEADPRLLQVAMTNLFGNAWKFSAKRSPARIEFGSAGENGSKEFFVRDNGVGFDMAYAGKLFGAFQRLHAMHEFPGTGIGLAIVQRVVRRHGGRVWADSVIDAGATFHFTLPRPEQGKPSNV